MERIYLENSGMDHNGFRYMCEGTYPAGSRCIPVARVAIYRQQDEGPGDYVRVDCVTIDRRATQETMRADLFLEAVWRAQRGREDREAA